MAAVKSPPNMSADGAGARQHQAAPHLGAIVGEVDDVATDRLAAHAGRVDGARHGADRGARDRDRPDAQFVERLEHRDMGKPARAAAAEREREALHQAPAARANDHAVAASGRTIRARAAACSLVAVPSRTRPAMPCRIAAMRKKL